MTNKKGFILVDVLLAIAIMGLIVTLVFPIMSNIFRRTSVARSEMQSTYIMQNTIEATYAAIASQRNWDSINPNQPFYPEENFTDRTWELKNGHQNNYEDMFRRWVEFHEVCRDPANDGVEVSCDLGTVDDNTRRMVVTLEWRDENGEDQQRVVQLLVSKFIR